MQCPLHNMAQPNRRYTILNLALVGKKKGEGKKGKGKGKGRVNSINVTKHQNKELKRGGGERKKSIDTIIVEAQCDLILK